MKRGREGYIVLTHAGSRYVEIAIDSGVRVDIHAEVDDLTDDDWKRIHEAIDEHEQEVRRRVASFPVIPANEADSALVDEMMAKRRAEERRVPLGDLKDRVDRAVEVLRACERNPNEMLEEVLEILTS